VKEFALFAVTVVLISWALAHGQHPSTVTSREGGKIDVEAVERAPSDKNRLDKTMDDKRFHDKTINVNKIESGRSNEAKGYEHLVDAGVKV
jgi:hypothetical protein